eukprot:TRINITY_DN5607_c0_g1_i1.p1 TRINITY_DN5607_c0_g1~~TRINITY_DN5607_c0_g1_i1.p1  ORF type:complete len:256 (+),score=58.44 TRINITY_DN5607_c0_g1_i1:84-770(+)
MGHGARSGTSALGLMTFARKGSKEDVTTPSSAFTSYRKGSKDTKDSQGSKDEPQKEKHCLSKQQMRDLLISVAPGKEDAPTEEEVAYMLRIYDDGRNLLKDWNKILQDRRAMAAMLHKFDKCNTGRLGKKELKEYLVYLNDGNDVSDKDVEQVLSAADVSGDGAIWPVELNLAAETWKEIRRKRRQPVSVSMFSLLTYGRKSIHSFFGLKSDRKLGRTVSGESDPLRF